ncbi:hypothetical protein FN976_22310 [Caenimonas sedimenti]|uniref:NIPSNAP domain-containing protein n=1 Tax=Caenimonas sedimenti TaxID=2596921 RepID=A0A562ZK07_9BURK|nr:NIPSNAP family protein [Caenimonas sedimenti]TWO68727.1 hypothetical protein FN976_22310 [Caenimonas sedimenti]
MIHFTRTSSIAPGKMADAMTFAAEMVEYIGTAHGQKMTLMVPVGGNPHRVCWYSAYDNLGEMEKSQVKLLADPKYLALLGKAATLFIAGSANDEMWRDL